MPDGLLGTNTDVTPTNTESNVEEKNLNFYEEDDLGNSGGDSKKGAEGQGEEKDVTGLLGGKIDEGKGIEGTATADDKQSKQEVDGKGKEGEEGKEDKPIEYGEFTIAQELVADTEALESAKVLFAKYGLSQEQAQELIDVQNQLMTRQHKEFAQKMQTETDQLLGKWENEVRADEELGGAKIKENMAIARSAAINLGVPEALAVISEANMSSNPAILRLLYRAGKALQESGYAVSGKGSKRNIPLEELMYGDNKK